MQLPGSVAPEHVVKLLCSTSISITSLFPVRPEARLCEDADSLRLCFLLPNRRFAGAVLFPIRLVLAPLRLDEVIIVGNFFHSMQQCGSNDNESVEAKDLEWIILGVDNRSSAARWTLFGPVVWASGLSHRGSHLPSVQCQSACIKVMLVLLVAFNIWHGGRCMHVSAAAEHAPGALCVHMHTVHARCAARPAWQAELAHWESK